MYSFIVCEFNPTERKIQFLGELAYTFGELGRSSINFKDMAAKEKYFEGAEEFSFRDLERPMHYFQGPRKHSPNPPPFGTSLVLGPLFQICWTVGQQMIRDVTKSYWTKNMSISN